MASEGDREYFLGGAKYLLVAQFGLRVCVLGLLGRLPALDGPRRRTTLCCGPSNCRRFTRRRLVDRVSADVIFDIIDFDHSVLYTQ